jgi:hypothetical protein
MCGTVENLHLNVRRDLFALEGAFLGLFSG